MTTHIPDLVRHVKDDAGREALHIGPIKVVPVFDCGGTAYVISRADFAEAVKAAYRLGYDAHTRDVGDTLRKLATELV